MDTETRPALTVIPPASDADVKRLERERKLARWAADPSGAPRWLPVDGAAAIASVSRRTIDRWVSAGLVRHSRPGGGSRVLVDRDDLLALLDQSAAEPVRAAAR